MVSECPIDVVSVWFQVRIDCSEKEIRLWFGSNAGSDPVMMCVSGVSASCWTEPWGVNWAKAQRNQQTNQQNKRLYIICHNLIIYFYYYFARILFSVHRNHLNHLSTKISLIHFPSNNWFSVQIYSHVFLFHYFHEIRHRTRLGLRGNWSKNWMEKSSSLHFGWVAFFYFLFFLVNDFSLCLLQDPHAEEFEDKDWTFVIENVSTALVYVSCWKVSPVLLHLKLRMKF